MKKPTGISLKNKTLVIGCGQLGATIANKFSKEGKNILIVDESERSFERLSEDFSGYTIVGECTDLEVLESAYIKSCKEAVIVTGDDSINVLVATIAKKLYNVPNVYVRLSDPDNEILLKGLG
ncbi:MAG: TrkA family potassium uptake protein, partial [Bacilli bacterium]|nr:TrkA family potassium uptake protein [Bacilli bacterium]